MRRKDGDPDEADHEKSAAFLAAIGADQPQTRRERRDPRDSRKYEARRDQRGHRDRSSHRNGRDDRGRRGRRGPAQVAVMGLGVLALVGVASAGWLVVRAQAARAEVGRMQSDAAQLQKQLAGYDLAGAATTMAGLRQHADRAHALTGDPVWAAATVLPVVGDDIRAARQTSAVISSIADAAMPLESALPRLQLTAADGIRLDPGAVAEIADAMPAISAAVSTGSATVADLDTHGLRPELASGVHSLQGTLAGARTPVSDAVPVLQLLPAMLGADGQRTWMVLLQQDAEARATGGLVGAYAILHTDHGRLSLVSAQSRRDLDAGPAIPLSAAPTDLQNLWGTDLTAWADLNLSPHFPWTGQLVAAGWARRHPPAPLNYVVGLDQGMVTAMLAGTGPVDVRGFRVDSGNAGRFLSRDIYARFSDPRDVDAVTAELVKAVFGRFTQGRIDLPAMVTAMREPLREGRLQVWAADADEQRQLEALSIGGALPEDPGPFAMAVVNNGGGNKLDAYLKVRTTYDPGACAQQVRVGRISVQLENDAPRSGLPAYVTPRSDLITMRRLGRPVPRAVVGSNRILLDIYGPVGGQAALTTLDGTPVTPTTGLDRSHPVWHVDVPIDPGQRRTIEVILTEPVPGAGAPAPAVVRAQPMVLPATITAAPVTACTDGKG